MSTRGFDEDENELVDFNLGGTIVAEVSPSTKLERRRRIEELFEKRELEKELAEFA